MKRVYNFQNYIIGLLFICLFSACEKVIQLDIPDGEAKIVIEGIIVNESAAHVKVSRSLPYDEVLGDHLIDDAVVILSTSYGATEQLKLKSSGIYSSRSILGLVGASYTLSVTVDEEEFVAESTMPRVTPIDTIYATYDPFPEVFDRPGDYRVDIDFSDDGEIENYYRLKGYVNRELLNDADAFLVFDDQLFNGFTFTIGMVANRFNLTDTVNYQLLSIDKDTYSYYTQLGDIIGGGSSSIPYNPQGNFSNDAVGYFSAQSSAISSIILEAEED